MKKMEFYDVEDFCLEVIGMYEDFCGSPDYDIAIISKYDEAREIIEYLTRTFPLYDIHICPPVINGYLDEYIISINEDGLWCEPAKSENGYLYDESTVTYVMDNCSSAVLKQLGGAFKYEVCIHECFKDEECESCTISCCDCDIADFCDNFDDDYEYEDCELCDCAETSLEVDDDMHGFSISESNRNGNYSFSFYSTSKNLVDEMLALFK